jgi:hypothetical protein
MAPSNAGGYLPGGPRYGLSGDELRRYYSDKPVQWVIFAWDGAARPACARLTTSAEGCNGTYAPDPRFPAQRLSLPGTCTPIRLTSKSTKTASYSADRCVRRTEPGMSGPRCCSNCSTARRPRNSGTTSRLLRTAAIRMTRGFIAGNLATDRSKFLDAKCSYSDQTSFAYSRRRGPADSCGRI